MCPAGKWAAEFNPMYGGLCTIMVHAARGSGFGAEDRILISQPGIGVGKVEVSETFNDIPSTAGNGIRVGIIFTKISNNKVLIGGMTARINR